MSKNEESGGSPNVIGQSAVLKGEIMFDEGVMIDGQVEGNITVKGDIVIGEHADIQANIHATNVHVRGCVKGNIQCAGVLTLDNSAQITGNISTVLLRVEEGASLQGKVSMKKNKEQMDMMPPDETNTNAEGD